MKASGNIPVAQIPSLHFAEHCIEISVIKLIKLTLQFIKLWNYDTEHD